MGYAIPKQGAKEKMKMPQCYKNLVRSYKQPKYGIAGAWKMKWGTGIAD